MSSEKVEELVETHLRRELDEIAEELGLDPSGYPNKRAVAEAIVMAQVRGREKMGVKKRMNKPLKGSVKDKINDIKKTTKAMQAGVKEIEAGIKAQADENARVVANMQAAINAQMTENEQYVKDFYG